jgi:hypothetical protein
MQQCYGSVCHVTTRSIMKFESAFLPVLLLFMVFSEIPSENLYIYIYILIPYSKAEYFFECIKNNFGRV